MFKTLKSGLLAFVALLTLLAVLAPVGAQAEIIRDVTTRVEDGFLVFESDDGAFKWWWDARIYLDVAGYMEDKNALSNGFMVRRARWAMKTMIREHWYAEVDFDFAEEATELKDAYLSYRGLFGGTGHLRVGNFRQPFGLEENITSRNLMFLERSQGTDAFAVGRRMGLEFAKWSHNYRVAASVFGADVEDFEKPDDETFSFAARLNYTPINRDKHILLLGASGSMRQTDFNTHKVRFKTKPETNVADVKYVDTGNIGNVDTYNLVALEAAYVNHRFLAMSEYMSTNVIRKDFSVNQDWDYVGDLSFGGGYVFAAFFLTDDTHPFDFFTMEPGRVNPSSENGAWELMARYSTVDMDDDTVDKSNKAGIEDQVHLYGASTSMTVGVKYYANSNVNIYLNYGMVDNNENATGKDGSLVGDDDFQYVQMRFLAYF